MVVGHVWRDGLRGISRNGSKVNGCYWDIHLREGGTKAIYCRSLVGSIAKLWRHRFSSIHSVWGEWLC